MTKSQSSGNGGFRKWWREQLEAPHPQSNIRTVPICPCASCYHGGDPHGGSTATFWSSSPSTSKTKSGSSGTTKNPLYLLGRTVSSSGSGSSSSNFGSAATLVEKGDGKGGDKAGAP